eukprot:gene21729-26135_t
MFDLYCKLLQTPVPSQKALTFPQISPGARESCVDAEVLSDCILQRVYVCDVEEACTHSEPRRNEGGAAHLHPSLMCAEGYDSDVVLCSGCVRGYTMTAEKACEKCSSRVAIVLTLVALFAAVMLVIGLMIYICKKYIAVVREARKQAEEEVGTGEMEAGACANIYTGWLQLLIVCLGIRVAACDAGVFTADPGGSRRRPQVAGQTRNVFKAEMIPPYYPHFLNIAALTNVSLVSWAAPACVAHEFIGGDFNLGTGGFYWSFLFCTVMPLLVIAPMPFLVLSWRQKKKTFKSRLRHMITFQDGAMAERQKTEMPGQWYPPLALFILVFIHPTVSTQMFQ